MRNRIVTALGVAAVLASPYRAAAADDFYQARLQEGRIAYQTGSAAEAADLLRIGCFGLMDQPVLHSEGLAWLVLAQLKLGRAVDADATLRRFLEVEKRFGVYAKVALPPETRKEFEGALAKRVPPDALRSLPTLARFVETEEQKLAKLAPKEKRRALEAKAAAEPSDPAWPLSLARLAVEGGAPKDALRWAGRVLELDAQNVEARRLRAGVHMGRRDFREALADLDQLPAAVLGANASLRGDRLVCLVAAKSWDLAREAAKELPEEQQARPDVLAAMKKLPPAAEAAALPAEDAPASSPPSASAPPAAVSIDGLKAQIRELLKAGTADKAKGLASVAVAAKPDDREARKLLLEAACMSRDWRSVAVQARILAPFVDGEEPSMFYAAVGLFETGSRDEAQPLMRRARPRIAATPFVNYYAERLLPKAPSE